MAKDVLTVDKLIDIYHEDQAIISFMKRLEGIGRKNLVLIREEAKEGFMFFAHGNEEYEAVNWLVGATHEFVSPTIYSSFMPSERSVNAFMRTETKRIVIYSLYNEGTPRKAGFDMQSHLIELSNLNKETSQYHCSIQYAKESGPFIKQMHDHFIVKIDGYLEDALALQIMASQEYAITDFVADKVESIHYLPPHMLGLLSLKPYGAINNIADFSIISNEGMSRIVGHIKRKKATYLVIDARRRVK